MGAQQQYQSFIRTGTIQPTGKDLFQKHECPGGNEVKIGYFQYKGHDQDCKVIDPGVIWKGLISCVCIQNMKSLHLTVQKLWARLKFLPQTDGYRQVKN